MRSNFDLSVGPNERRWARADPDQYTPRVTGLGRSHHPESISEYSIAQLLLEQLETEFALSLYWTHTQ